jgi:hypothetical protein
MLAFSFLASSRGNLLGFSQSANVRFCQEIREELMHQRYSKFVIGRTGTAVASICGSRKTRSHARATRRVRANTLSSKDKEFITDVGAESKSW